MIADALPIPAKALDVVLVVQRRIAHDHTANCHRFQLGNRRQGSGSPDLYLDVIENGCRFFSRKLVCNGPARRARNKAEPVLQIQPVNLVDHTVDVVTQRRPFRFHISVQLNHLLHALAALHQRVGRQSPGFHGFDHTHLRIGWKSTHLTPGIGEEMQLSLCGYGRIKLAQRP